ncbi:pentatricopeptide repeat-containing protein At1g77405-like [Triticum dicoccoides]|uniref:Pentacotripeptide-repeat region of PRORP domain-containing protein n=1 Tax=Triticum aestivum TaxID=4565 RepID=A0A3B6IM30_WHEAT|nr:pentatricopeptide repeat-containing protein At1g77405-like [Triticum dicoccoides]XP_044368348.1 pentatricopeptide repeat-containing protein At1g77405-like [Triticum aestivum]
MSSSSPSPSPSRLVPQLLVALLQRRRFDSALRPSPTFRGFSPSSIAASLAAIPRLILPRSAGRLCPQRPFPSPSSSYHRRVAAALTLAFLNWSHSDAIPHAVPLTEAPLRAAALSLARARALPALFGLLREHAPLVSTAALTDVIRALGEEGLPRQALAAFHRARQLRCSPDAQCYNTLLAALCRNGRFKEARFLLDQMERPGARCKPDSYTYTVLISWYCRIGAGTGCRKAARRRIYEAGRVFRRMGEKGLEPDVVTYNCYINGLCKTYRVERAHEVFDGMVKKGCMPNRVTYNSFVRYYSAVNKVNKAIEWMRDMVARGHGVATSSTYTPLIHSLYESGRIGDARRFMIEMVESGHLPREHTYKLVKDATEGADEEALPAELCHSIEEGIKERFQQVMRMKPIMRPVTR